MRLNTTGGEDSLLLKHIVSGGGRLAWARGAHVIEWVPSRRLNWDYLRKRKFLNGQVRVFVHTMVQPAEWPRVAFWMGVGLVQCGVGGAATLVLRAIDANAAERARLVLSAGLGKMLWMSRFRPALYGHGHVS